MSICPFWSDSKNTVKCNDECPFYSDKEESTEECPFKLYSYKDLDNLDDNIE